LIWEYLEHEHRRTYTQKNLSSSINLNSNPKHNAFYNLKNNNPNPKLSQKHDPPKTQADPFMPKIR